MARRSGAAQGRFAVPMTAHSTLHRFAHSLPGCAARLLREDEGRCPHGRAGRRHGHLAGRLQRDSQGAQRLLLPGCVRTGGGAMTGTRLKRLSPCRCSSSAVVDASRAFLMLLDREPVAEHLPLAWTKSSKEDRQVCVGDTHASPALRRSGGRATRQRNSVHGSLFASAPMPRRNSSTTWTSLPRSTTFWSDPPLALSAAPERM